MARGRRSRAPKLLISVLVVAGLIGAAWLLWQRSRPVPPLSVPAASAPSTAPLDVSAERIDAANEGRRVTIDGTLRVAKTVHDAQLGIEANAIALLRDVEMLQWREQCAAKCEYALAWSPRHIDSSAFRDPKGHANGTAFPFSSERFLSDDVRLGAYKVDAALAAAGPVPVAYPVQVAQLPPNLAATFRERDGMLYAGADPQQGGAGDLRVSYRIVPPGPRRLTGVQSGERLKSASGR